jgi:hypothetical protein
MPGPHRYAEYDPRWLPTLLRRLGWYRLLYRLRGPSAVTPDYQGCAVVVTSWRSGLPPIGTKGEVDGYQEQRRGVLTYCVRFPDRSPMWMVLPREGIELIEGATGGESWR